MTERGRDRACILGTAAGAFLLYLITACPTVPPGDSGELIAAAWTAGVPHPPGYPLYTLAGWLWSHVLWPVGNVAWRLNLFSGAAMAAAAGFCVAGARAAGAGRWAAVTAAATFALAAEPWRAAVAAEVFAGHACFTAAVLWLLIRWGRAPAVTGEDGAERPAPPAMPWVAALVLGLSGAHHQTSVLLVPAVWFWAFAHRARFGEPLAKRAGLCIAVAGAAALLPYLVLMPLSTRDQALVWGDLTTIGDDTGFSQGTAKPESARIVPRGGRLPDEVVNADYSGLGEGLWHHMRRGAYGGKLGSRSGRDAGAGSPLKRAGHVAAWLGVYAASGAGGLWLLALGFATFGAWRLWREREETRGVPGTLLPAAAVALVLAGGGDLTGFLLVALACGPALGFYAAARATPQARLVSFLVLAWFVTGPLFIAYGVNFDPGSELHRAVVSRFFVLPAVPLTLLGALGLQALGDWKGAGALQGAGVGSAALAGVLALAGGASLAGVHGVEIYGRNLLASIPEDPKRPALLFVQGDVPNNAIDYLQFCEGERPDVAMVNQQKLTYPWAVRQYQRRFVDPRLAVDIPGERYDGRLVTNVNLADANISRRRIYFFGFATGDVSYRTRYWRVPHGLVSALVPKGAKLDLDVIERDNLAILESFDWPSILTTPGDAYFLDEVREAHAKAWCDLAIFFHTGPNEAGAPVDFAKAERIYKRTLELFPDHLNAVLGYGLLLAEKLGRPAEAKPLLIRYLQARPEDPRTPQIAALAGVPAPK